MSQQSLAALRSAINEAYLANEPDMLKLLAAELDTYDPAIVGETATSWVTAIRNRNNRQSMTEAFLREYQLDSQEGLVLMSLAEALLRIPDSHTQDLFLQEKLTHADWRHHIQHSHSLWVNLSSQALLYTRQFEEHVMLSEKHWFPIFDSMLSRLGAPLIRLALKKSMQYLSDQFVFADTIENATVRMNEAPAYRYSFDMLGEAAITADDADRYFQAYRHAIDVLSQHATSTDVYANPGVSIKLSALYPRYEPLQHRRAVQELSEKLLALAVTARAANISVTIDAEESERLDMSLTIFANVFIHPSLNHWPGFGLAVQAYQKRALAIIRWLAELAESQGKKIPVRLVKGAYWDSEIKRGQEQGLKNYPVFTNKALTDVSYLACSQLILTRHDLFYGQFASHNAHTLAAIYHSAIHHNRAEYEFQRLQGMGDTLYRDIIVEKHGQIPCRIYAPVGPYHELLPYLVRRLLENGANSSFINQLDHPAISTEALTADPIEQAKRSPNTPRIVMPTCLYGEKRLNSQGLNVADLALLERLQNELASLAAKSWQAAPLVAGTRLDGEPHPITNPSESREIVGTVVFATHHALRQAVACAAASFNEWRIMPVSLRANFLLNAANLLERHRMELVSLAIREGGRTLKDALAEVREAVDYCRYYAQSATELFAEPIALPGPTGEENLLRYYGRGVFVCISPWNFPIALFIGQVTGALAAGNCVIAKPASQTALTAMRCIEILHRAGIPESVLQFVPAGGEIIEETLLADPRIAGVAFTGSIETARRINLQLAQRNPAIVPLIAETGGQNVMIADSSALLEQLVQDAVTSAFNSAGQRCSALRVLFVQEEIADKTLSMMLGAMRELSIGNPRHYSVDVGPVINRNAVSMLNAHIESIYTEAKLIYQVPIAEDLTGNGCFFPPTLLEITDFSQLDNEVFGPVLHFIRFRFSEIDRLIEIINAAGYGLTLGIHSRIDSHIKHLQQGIKAGNIYVNRNMIGAVVGVQPFGGMGLSGTGPKAGGPNYLRRFAVEQTLTTNTAAIGGNTALLVNNTH